jgi:pimeloyl-ACP methyl ester carboxylesterase
LTGKRGVGKVVAAMVFVIMMTAAGAQAGTWIRHDSSSRGVIVFVHGIMGDERSTWTSGSSYWPEMLTHDHTFDGQDIYLYHYPSPHLDRAFTIDEIAENMRLVLTADGVLQHTEITFVSHGMGGIVTRAYVLKYRQELVPKIRFLFFFATPTTGTPYARLGGLVSRNPQFKELYPMDADSYLAPLQSDWLAAGMKLRSFCAYETQPLYGQVIVDRQSASNLCTEHLDPIDADHVSIVKPRDQNSTPYLALKDAFLRFRGHP